jgi:hypothetical protein
MLARTLCKVDLWVRERDFIGNRNSQNIYGLP